MHHRRFFIKKTIQACQYYTGLESIEGIELINGVLIVKNKNGVLPPVQKFDWVIKNDKNQFTVMNNNTFQTKYQPYYEDSDNEI